MHHNPAGDSRDKCHQVMCLCVVVSSAGGCGLGSVQQDAHRRGDADGDKVARQQVDIFPDTSDNNDGHLESLFLVVEGIKIPETATDVQF